MVNNKAPFLTRAHSALQLLTTFTVTKYTSTTVALSQADITCSLHTGPSTDTPISIMLKKGEF